MGSASELEYHLLLAKDLGFLSEGDYDALVQQSTDIQRMLTGLMQRLKRTAEAA